MMADRVSPQVKVPLDGEERGDRAVVAVLQALLEVIEANFDGAIADLDSEYLHDLRVSVRRSRAVQRELRGVFPPEALRGFRDEFRWLQRATGEARDLDVHLEEFGAMASVVPTDLQGDLDVLLKLIGARRDAAHAEMVDVLRSERTRALLSAWREFLAGLESRRAKDRPDAKRPIAELAGQRIRRVYRRTVRLGLEIGPESPGADYHELRKQGKELRYLLELFGLPLFPEEVVRPMIKTLKGVQDVLGSHQDREVQEAELGALTATGSAPAGGGTVGPELVKLLTARLEGDKLAVRAAFPERLARLASTELQEIVKQVFR
jgi:CHAD domain-containing protein